MKKFNELYRPSEQGVTYERYCGILDEILVEELQEQGKGFDALSKKGQQDYLKKHPKSKKGVTAKDKEAPKEPEDKEEPKEPKDKEEPKEPKKTDGVDLDKYTKSTDDEEDKIKIKNIATKLKNHINDVTKETGLGVKEAVEAFKQPGVYNTLKGVGFSMKTLGKTVLGGLKTGNEALKVLLENLQNLLRLKH